MLAGTTPAATPIIADPALLERLTGALMTANPADAAVRIAKGADLVAVQAYERTARPGYWLVYSLGRPDCAYQTTERTCSCPDYQRRGERCKHVWCVVLAGQLERLEAEAALDVDAPVPYLLTAEALAYLDGEACDLPAQCSQCHAEPAIASHRDRLGQRCVLAELFGDNDPAA